MNLHGQPNRDAASSGAVRGRDPLDPRVLDWLVDGELTSAELQLVVRALENAPAGWRSCGLAFLEAQAFRQALGGDLFLGREADEAPAAPQGKAVVLAFAPPQNAEKTAGDRTAASAAASEAGRTAHAPNVHAANAHASAPDVLAMPTAAPAHAEAGPAYADAARPAPKRRGLRSWVESSSWIGLAATVFLSFGVGTWAGPRAARWLAPPDAPTKGTPLPQPVPSVAEGPAAVEGNDLEFVNVRAPGAGGVERTIRVPVVNTPALQEEWLQGVQGDDYRARLEAAGHEVEEQQMLVPVTLPDGRTMLLPMQQLRVSPAEPKEWQ